MFSRVHQWTHLIWCFLFCKVLILNSVSLIGICLFRWSVSSCALLGLHCRAGFYLVAASGGYSPAASPAAVHGLKAAQASAAAARGLRSCGSWTLERRLYRCGTQAQPLHSMWDLPDRDQTRVSCIGRQILHPWATREAPLMWVLRDCTLK